MGCAGRSDAELGQGVGQVAENMREPRVLGFELDRSLLHARLKLLAGRLFVDRDILAEQFLDVLRDGSEQITQLGVELSGGGQLAVQLIELLSKGFLGHVRRGWRCSCERAAIVTDSE
jgi:hypothetical protein